MELDTGFGWVKINNRKYEGDIIIYPDGKIEKRRKDLSENKKSIYGHTPLSKEEIELYLSNCKSKPNIVLIAAGQYGVLPIETEVIRKLTSKGIRVIIGNTKDILEIVEEFYGKNSLIIIHTTC